MDDLNGGHAETWPFLCFPRSPSRRVQSVHRTRPGISRLAVLALSLLGSLVGSWRSGHMPHQRWPVGCCGSMLHGAGPRPLQFLALRVTHRCMDCGHSPVPGLQAALATTAPQMGAPCTTGCSDLAACPGPGKRRKLQRGNGNTTPKSTHCREREPDDGTHTHDNLGPRKTNKNRVSGVSGHYFSTGGGWVLSVFCRRD